MNRRSFLRQVFAAAVVVATSPTALVAPDTWKRVKKWRNGYLTSAQAERFIQIAYDESVIAKDVKIVPMRVGKMDKIRVGADNRTFSVEKLNRIRNGKTPIPGAIEGTRIDLIPEGEEPSERPKLTNRELVKKLKDITDPFV